MKHVTTTLILVKLLLFSPPSINNDSSLWQSWWFIGLIIAVLGMLVAGGFRWRLNTIRRQNAYLETQISEQTSELRETNKLLEKEVEQRKRAEEALAKRAAEELHQSEERFHVMFENAGIGIALVGMDRHPLEANAAMIEMTGYNPEEFFQKSGVELSYSEDADIGIPELKDVWDGRLNSYQIEKRYIRKNGQIYWVRLTNSVVRAPDGKPQYFVTMVEDINERKHVAEELYKSQARFQAIFDNVAVGVAVMTLERQLATTIQELTARNPGRFNEVVPHLNRAGNGDAENEFKVLRPGGHRESLAYDPNGFFVITLDRQMGEIIVRHYLKDNTPAHSMSGRNAEAIMLGLLREGLISQMSHAGYLGSELAKAETALRLNLNYEQDQPLRQEKDSIGI